MIRALADLIRLFLKYWLWTALLSAALMLAIAHAFETFGGLAPCILCLQQREVYWTAMAVAAAGLAAHYLPVRDRFDWLFNAILAVIFLVGLGIAVRHAGAEWKWWPGPAACAANRVTVTAADLGAIMSGAKLKAPSCEEAAWRFLGLSMAGWNALISLKLAFWSAVAATGWRPRRG
ncbi:MAG: disulfide bond formation protein [Caulobacteraceae bacterium]|nr:disulfide bond formation protein [Caulobacteraceae bacterium]